MTDNKNEKESEKRTRLDESLTVRSIKKGFTGKSDVTIDPSKIKVSNGRIVRNTDTEQGATQKSDTSNVSSEQESSDTSDGSK